jgi:hypothetical protein
MFAYLLVNISMLHIVSFDSMYNGMCGLSRSKRLDPLSRQIKNHFIRICYFLLLELSCIFYIYYVEKVTFLYHFQDIGKRSLKIPKE